MAIPRNTIHGNDAVDTVNTANAAHQTMGGIDANGKARAIALETGGGLKASGSQANSDVISSNPIATGFRAIDPTSLPTAVTAGDLVYGGADTYGRVFTRPADLARDSDSVTTYPADNTLTSSTAAAASLVGRSSAGTLITIMGYSANAGTQFIQVHDAASLPADAAVPKIVIVAAATSNFTISIPEGGAEFTTGIVVCNSSTYATKTIGSADCFFSVVHRAT